MCPRSGFRSGGTCECTLVTVFVPGEHPNVPSFRFSFAGTSVQTILLENHPFVNPRMFVRDGAVTPGLSRECDITFFAKGRPISAQQLRDSTVAAGCHANVIPPGYGPPLKKCPILDRCR